MVPSYKEKKIIRKLMKIRSTLSFCKVKNKRWIKSTKKKKLIILVLQMIKRKSSNKIK